MFSVQCACGFYLYIYPVCTVQGMACVGRTKVCTIVPSNHFGAIPGVPVGTLWKFRVQVSQHYTIVFNLHACTDKCLACETN